jgi:hypothetical protein
MTYSIKLTFGLVSINSRPVQIVRMWRAASLVGLLDRANKFHNGRKTVLKKEGFARSANPSFTFYFSQDQFEI